MNLLSLLIYLPKVGPKREAHLNRLYKISSLLDFGIFFDNAV